VNNTIFFRNYQILNELSKKFCNDDDVSKIQLVEIGPRFSMTIVRIFDGVLGGRSLFANPYYLSPSSIMKRNYNAFLARRSKKLKNEEELDEMRDKTKGKDTEHEWLNE